MVVLDSKIEQRVKRHITQYRAKGYSDKNIREALLKSGIDRIGVSRLMKAADIQRRIYKKLWGLGIFAGLLFVLIFFVAFALFQQILFAIDVYKSGNESSTILSETVNETEETEDVEISCGDGVCGDGEDCGLDCGCDFTEDCPEDYICSSGSCEYSSSDEESVFDDTDDSSSSSGGGSSSSSSDDEEEEDDEGVSDTSSFALVGEACSSDVDCESGICSVDLGVCGDCTSDNDCVEGESCSSDSLCILEVSQSCADITSPSCADGADNDGDGSIDLEDDACRSWTDDEVAAVVAECSFDTDCSSGEVCDTGVCIVESVFSGLIGSACADDSDCLEGSCDLVDFICEDCSSSLDCGAYACSEVIGGFNSCTDSCSSNAECNEEEGYVCAISSLCAEDLNGDGIADVDEVVISCDSSTCSLGYVCDTNANACYSSCSDTSACASGYACSSSLCFVDSDGDGVANVDEISGYACSDGRDNDGDGTYDYTGACQNLSTGAIVSCQGTASFCQSRCAAGTYFAADSGCSNTTDDTEASASGSRLRAAAEYVEETIFIRFFHWLFNNA